MDPSLLNPVCSFILYISKLPFNQSGETMNNEPKYYSLEAEAKRVSNNLKNLTKLVNDYGLPKKPKYMLEEVAFLERELEFLKEETRKRYSNKSAPHQLAFISA